MIHSIDIRSLGVIDRARLDFGPGLTVLTGETGAGKTMVLTSLHLLLGSRADPGWVRAGAERAEVDGIFLIDEATAGFVDDLGGVVEDGELMASRTLAAQGRSRAQLGGRAVPAATLAEAIAPLITIHGQTDQLKLRSAAVQRATLDSYGDDTHRELLSEYSRLWTLAVHAKQRLDKALHDADDTSARVLLLTDLTQRIANLDPQPGEDDELRREAERLTNVEDLRAHVGVAHAFLTGNLEADASGIVDSLRSALKELTDAERLDPGLAEYSQALKPLVLDLESAADDIGTYLNNLEDDPRRLAQIHERRAALKAVMKGRAADVDELLAWQDAALTELAELTAAESDPEALAQALTEAQDRVRAAGEKLRKSRQKLAVNICERVNVELAGLSMPDARFSIDLNPTKPGPHGTEDVHMLLQPHPSAPARPLGNGASGGELSRVMLAIEVVLGSQSSAHTYVFDEVDAGIGGRTATAVGARLAALAKTKQVVVVTHLPQVAAYATTHLMVEKNDGLTSVRTLNRHERIVELARMAGGDPDSAAARRHAAELLDRAVSESDR